MFTLTHIIKKDISNEKKIYKNESLNKRIKKNVGLEDQRYFLLVSAIKFNEEPFEIVRVALISCCKKELNINNNTNHDFRNLLFDL